MKPNLFYKLWISSSSAFIGLVGFWSGYKLILWLIAIQYNLYWSVLMFLGGFSILWLLKKIDWQSQYNKSLNGSTYSLPLSYFYVLTLGFSMPLIVLPTGSLISFALNLIYNLVVE